MKRHLFLLFCVFFIGGMPQAHAVYSDEVDAGYQEIWKAAQQVLQPLGIRKVNEKKGEIISRWQEDVVERRRGVLKKIAAANMIRRYRIRYKLTQSNEWVKVEVRGVFEEKPTGSTLTVPWTKVMKLDRQDLDLERSFFLRVLQQMAANRNSSSG